MITGRYAGLAPTGLSPCYPTRQNSSAHRTPRPTRVGSASHRTQKRQSQVTIGRLGSVRSTPYDASTSDLSTWSSPRNLRQRLPSAGDLIWRRVSHLDAFSGSPSHTSLPSDAPGGTTGTRAVCPSRSSRTKDSPAQISSRPRQIGTELSHDVLNPARVPF